MIYIVQKGDTLDGIALKLLGSASASSSLWQINRSGIKSGNPQKLAAGEKIVVPDQMIRGSKSSRVTSANSNEVVLEVNGIEYAGWQSVRISKSLETASASFDVDLFDRWQQVSEPWPIFDQDEVKVWIGPDLLVSGYVDSVSLSIDGESHGMRVSGRDRTADLIDCSATNRPGTFKNKKLEDLAQILASPFGIKVTTDQDTGDPIASFALLSGEKVHEAIARAAIAKNLIVTSGEGGSLLITRSGSRRSIDAITEGKNLLAGSVDVSSTDRFSNYIVEGQSSGQGKATNAMRGTYRDAGVNRYRPLMIHAEQKATASYLSGRAEWEARSRAAKAKVARVTVVGWRQSNGQIWTINRVVPISSSLLNIDEEMLIAEVSFELSDSGMLTNMRLVRPDAYSSEVELKAEKKNERQRRKGAKKASSGGVDPNEVAKAKASYLESLKEKY